MKSGITQRGFGITKFKDGNGLECSIQESSAIRMDTGMLWLGVHEDRIQYMTPEGWQNFDPKTLGKEVIVHNRMHLTQGMVKELLPLLTHFAEHGELP